VSEEQADRKARLPVKKIDSVDTGFDGGDLVTGSAKPVDFGDGLAGILPGQGLFRSERRLGDHVLRRVTGDAGQAELFDTGGIAGAEECADVVKAADVLQQDSDGQRPNALIRRGSGRGAKGSTMIHSPNNSGNAHAGKVHPESSGFQAV